MERIATHVPHLDYILRGGLPAYSINLITGGPGTGKTVLAQQFVFGNATPQERALYVTTLSEPMSKVVRYGQEFTFFDLDKVGTAILYEDLGERLYEGNGEQAVEWVLELVAEYDPRFLVVDSFKAIHDLAESPPTFRRALYRLVGALSARACTTLLLGEYAPDALAEAPEFSVVDGIIELVNRRVGVVDERALRVLKLRGSDYHTGEHAFAISAAGIRVFPRFVTPPEPVTYAVSEARCSTGIQGLDELLGGGILRGTATLVVGEPGTGKTVTALHFLLQGARRGEPGVYVSFQEDPNQLTQIARNFGWDVEGLVAQGVLDMFYTSPVELNIDEHAIKINERVRALKAQRMVVDSISDMEAGAIDVNRYFNYVYALVQRGKNVGLTMLLTSEISEIFGTIILTGKGLSHIADNVILLRYLETESAIRRALTVLKARGTDHSTEIREYLISRAEGLRVGTRFTGLHSLLSGRPLVAPVE